MDKDAEPCAMQRLTAASTGDAVGETVRVSACKAGLASTVTCLLTRNVQQASRDPSAVCVRRTRMDKDAEPCAMQRLTAASTGDAVGETVRVSACKAGLASTVTCLLTRNVQQASRDPSAVCVRRTRMDKDAEPCAMQRLTAASTGDAVGETVRVSACKAGLASTVTCLLTRNVQQASRDPSAVCVRRTRMDKDAEPCAMQRLTAASTGDAVGETVRVSACKAGLASTVTCLLTRNVQQASRDPSAVCVRRTRMDKDAEPCAMQRLTAASTGDAVGETVRVSACKAGLASTVTCLLTRNVQQASRDPSAVCVRRTRMDKDAEPCAMQRLTAASTGDAVGETVRVSACKAGLASTVTCLLTRNVQQASRDPSAVCVRRTRMDKDAEPCAMQRLTAASTGDAVGETVRVSACKAGLASTVTCLLTRNVQQASRDPSAVCVRRTRMDKDAEPCAMQRLTAATTGDAVGETVRVSACKAGLASTVTCLLTRNVQRASRDPSAVCVRRTRMDKDAEPCAMQRLTAASTGDAVGETVRVSACKAGLASTVTCLLTRNVQQASRDPSAVCVRRTRMDKDAEPCAMQRLTAASTGDAVGETVRVSACKAGLASTVTCLLTRECPAGFSGPECSVCEEDSYGQGCGAVCNAEIDCSRQRAMPWGRRFVSLHARLDWPAL